MIRFTRARYQYPDGTVALHDLTLALAPGGMYFVTGRSGAGKSTLLRLLYGAARPTSGALELFGADVSTLSRDGAAALRRRIGVVFQDFRLLDHLSVFDNVALPLMVAGRREPDYRDNVLEMLAWVKLADRIDAKPSHLSGGEKQRVSIARAMVSVPELIVADEPTGSVDPEMGARIMALFMEMHRLGRTVVIATHDLELVRRSGAPRLHLDEGRLAVLEPAT